MLACLFLHDPLRARYALPGTGIVIWVIDDRYSSIPWVPSYPDGLPCLPATRKTLTSPRPMAARPIARYSDFLSDCSVTLMLASCRKNLLCRDRLGVYAIYVLDIDRV